MLNLVFSMVLDMPWLKAVGLPIDWSNGAVAFKCSDHWISLPLQLSDILPTSHEPCCLLLNMLLSLLRM